MQNKSGWGLRKFLERIEIPLLLVDSEGSIVMENEMARQVLGKPADAIEGNRGGVVFDCVHSFEPGGCGGTIHCKSCTIRNTVEETFRTGQPVYRRGATLRVIKDASEKDIASYISTSLADDVVILQIEDISVS